MSYNNLNNYTPFGFRDSLSLVTSKVQEIQVGYMHPYRISLTGTNLTYTASQLLNNSIDRYQTGDPSLDFLPSASDIVTAVTQNSYIGFTPGMYFDVAIRNASTGTLFVYPGTGVVGSPTQINSSGLSYIRLTLNSSLSVNATVISTYFATGGSFPSPTGGAGTQGFQGPIGVQGLIGFQGIAGTTGTNGSQGLQGLIGSTGSIGSQGLQGLIGSTGSIGPQGGAGMGFVVFANTTSYTGLNTVIATGGNIGQFVLVLGGDLFVYAGTGSGYTGPGNSYGYAGDVTDESKLVGLQGYQGFQGLIGSTGSIGPQGLQGLIGDTGVQGLEGSQGLIGDTGVQGYQGLQGLIGDTGVQGLEGSQGLIGSTGMQGYQGLQGLDGSTGIQGYQGLQGLVGSTGMQGYQGLQGLDGSTGMQGYQGLDGSTGMQGYQGLQGLVGSTGMQGYQGIIGSTGSIGPQGGAGMGFVVFANTTSYTGLNTVIATGGNIGQFVLVLGGDLFVYAGTGSGYTGPGNSYGYAGDVTDESKLVGFQGYQGLVGSTGMQGYQGLEGLQGLVGSTGMQGYQGLEGLQGLVGSTGMQGYQGLQGLVGSTGMQGLQGLEGLAGSTGSIGPQGGAGMGFVVFANTTSYTGLNTVIATGGNIGQFVLVLGGDLFVYAGTGSGYTGPGNSYGYAGDVTDESKLVGFQGAQGLMGATGTIGLQGYQGLEGPQGLIGSTGDIGLQGLQGLVGPTGSIGPQGLIGFTGTIGPQGLVGPTGSNSSSIQGTIDVYYSTAGAFSRVSVNSVISATASWTANVNARAVSITTVPTFTMPTRSIVSVGRTFIGGLASNYSQNIVHTFGLTTIAVNYDSSTNTLSLSASTTGNFAAFLGISSPPTNGTEYIAAQIYLNY